MSEKAIAKRIQKKLKELNWWVTKLHGGPYQRAGLPDLLCVSGDGRVMFIEVKRPGKRPTPRQAQTMHELKLRGVTVILATSWEDVLEYYCHPYMGGL